MKLLLIAGEDAFDEVLCVVEDNYNEDEVLKEAGDTIGVTACTIELEVNLADQGRGKFSLMRMYLG